MLLCEVQITESKRRYMAWAMITVMFVLVFVGFIFIVFALYIGRQVGPFKMFLDGYAFTSLWWMLMFCGVFMITCSLAGSKLVRVSMTIKKRPNLNLLFLVFMAILLIFLFCEFAMSVMCLTEKSKLRNSVSKGFNKALSAYDKDLEIKQAVDIFQMNYACCGEKSYSDWFQVQWIQAKYMTHEPNVGQHSDRTPYRNGEDSVPFSCCDIEAKRPCVHEHVEKTVVGYDSHHDRTLYDTGCTEVIANSKRFSGLVPIGNVGLIVCLLLVLLLVIMRYYQTSIAEAVLYGDPTKATYGYLYSDMIGTYIPTATGIPSSDTDNDDDGDVEEDSDKKSSNSGESTERRNSRNVSTLRGSQSRHSTMSLDFSRQSPSPGGSDTAQLNTLPKSDQTVTEQSDKRESLPLKSVEHQLTEAQQNFIGQGGESRQSIESQEDSQLNDSQQSNITYRNESKPSIQSQKDSQLNDSQQSSIAYRSESRQNFQIQNDSRLSDSQQSNTTQINESKPSVQRQKNSQLNDSQQNNIAHKNESKQSIYGQKDSQLNNSQQNNIFQRNERRPSIDIQENSQLNDSQQNNIVHKSDSPQNVARQSFIARDSIARSVSRGTQVPRENIAYKGNLRKKILRKSLQSRRHSSSQHQHRPRSTSAWYVDELDHSDLNHKNNDKKTNKLGLGNGTNERSVRSSKQYAYEVHSSNDDQRLAYSNEGLPFGSFGVGEGFGRSSDWVGGDGGVWERRRLRGRQRRWHYSSDDTDDNGNSWFERIFLRNLGFGQKHHDESVGHEHPKSGICSFGRHLLDQFGFGQRKDEEHRGYRRDEMGGKNQSKYGRKYSYQAENDKNFFESKRKQYSRDKSRHDDKFRDTYRPNSRHQQQGAGRKENKGCDQHDDERRVERSRQQAIDQTNSKNYGQMLSFQKQSSNKFRKSCRSASNVSRKRRSGSKRTR